MNNFKVILRFNLRMAKILSKKFAKRWRNLIFDSDFAIIGVSDETWGD